MFIVLAGTNNNNSGSYDPDLHLSFHKDLESAQAEFETWTSDIHPAFQVVIVKYDVVTGAKEVVDANGWNEDGWESVRGWLELK